eukprot:scaffold3098_cov73-Isochrysis_galbana.AAC.1
MVSDDSAIGVAKMIRRLPRGSGVIAARCSAGSCAPGIGAGTGMGTGTGMEVGPGKGAETGIGAGTGEAAGTGMEVWLGAEAGQK